MPRKVVRKERGVFEKVPGSGIWWIRFKADGVEHREKVGRRGDAAQPGPRPPPGLRPGRFRGRVDGRAQPSPVATQARGRVSLPPTPAP